MWVFLEEDWALIVFTSCYSDQWADFPAGMQLWGCSHVTKLFWSALQVKSWQPPSPAPGWHRSAEPQAQFSHTSTNCTTVRGVPIPVPPRDSLPTWTQPQQSPPWSLLACSIMAAKAVLWNKTFSYSSQDSQRCLTALFEGFLIGKEIRKHFVNLLLNSQQLLALKNERKSLVVVHWPQRAAQHHIALPLFTPLPSRTEEENRKNRSDQTHESRERHLTKEQKGKSKAPQTCAVWSNGPNTLNFASQPLFRAQWLFK